MHQHRSKSSQDSFTMKGWQLCCCIQCQVYLAAVFSLKFYRTVVNIETELLAKKSCVDISGAKFQRILGRISGLLARRDILDVYIVFFLLVYQELMILVVTYDLLALSESIKTCTVVTTSYRNCWTMGL